MKIHDLTHLLTRDIPVFPGTEQPVIKEAYSIDGDGFAKKKVTFSSHTGTHIDAPTHILRDALSLDKLPVNSFMGEAICCKLDGNPSRPDFS